MKRVLHVLPTSKLSGAEKMSLLICENLKLYEPFAVCGGKELSNVFQDKKINVYNIEGFNKNIFLAIKKIALIVKKNNINLIHAHDNRASLISFLAIKFYKLDIKILSHIHSCYPWLKTMNLNKFLDYIFRKRYDLNLACGELVYEYYSKNTNYFEKKTYKKLSNAINFNEILSKKYKSNEFIKKKFNIPKEKIIIGFIGRLEVEKGLIEFIEEFKHHKEKFSDCIFLLIGSGTLELKIKILLKKYNLDSLFILTGFQRDILDFYNVIDIFFLPSLYEGLPMVLLENIAFKNPVISMDVGSVNEIIINNETGFLIEKNNYNNFIEKLNELVKNSEIRRQFSCNAYKLVKERYEIENYIQKLEGIYDNLL